MMEDAPTQSLIDNFSEFLGSILCCPVSKEPLREAGGTFVAQCGLRYPRGDFRVGLEFAREWRTGQEHYERFHSRWIFGSDFQETDAELDVLYQQLGLAGRVLDIGGGPGIVARQARLDPATFVALDAAPCLWRDIPPSPFTRHYSDCAGLCRVPAFAEFLPVRSGSVDAVHMRSCLDHFANPVLALREAFRVLRPGGGLVVGLALEGAYRKDQGGLLQSAKVLVKKIAPLRELYERLFDHHLFHPTLPAVTRLLEEAGFAIRTTLWQPSYHNVVYLRAER